MKKIKAIIFDIDGTLADTLPLCIEAFRQTAEPLVHHPLSDKEIEDAFGPNEAGTIKELAPDSDYEKAAHDFLHHYESLHTMCLKAFDGITDLLETLKSKSIYLAIASGKGKESSEMSLERFGITSFFTIVKNGSLDGKQKPADIDSIVQSFGTVTKEETVYIGDSASDIKDSRKAGVRVVAAAWAPRAKIDQLKKEQPDELFTSVTDLTNWLYANI